mmetsp:Transcript_17257/g.25004  ORF Transcript_17257/g.25004 Transcript_17257/m.25004 type:complete len:135 (-) Transcript_17257:35-439(-)
MLLFYILILTICNLYFTIQHSSMESSASSQFDSFAELADNETTDILLLPPPTTIEGDETETPQLKLGDTLKLDKLGPIIINSDGTTRRITNWDNLTKHEQESTYRVISARNKRRLDQLRRELAENPPDGEGGKN